MSNEIKPTRRGFLAGLAALLGLAPVVAKAETARPAFNPFDSSYAAGVTFDDPPAYLPMAKDGGPVIERWHMQRRGTYRISGHVGYHPEHGAFVSVHHNGKRLDGVDRWPVSHAPLRDEDSVVTVEALISVEAGDRVEIHATPSAACWARFAVHEIGT